MDLLYGECMAEQTLLLNWVYYHPIGHALEAFKAAKGFTEANPGVDVHVLLNSRTVVELADACPWIARAYPIDLEEIASKGTAASCLQPIPRTWDFIVNDHRPTASPFFFADSLRTFHDLAEIQFSAREWRGGHHRLPSGGPPFYVRNATIRLSVPDSAKEFVRDINSASLRICVLPAGSSDEAIYPKVDWWLQAINAIKLRWPAAQFFFTGKSAIDDRTSTMAFPHDKFKTVLAGTPGIIDCYDIGLWNQMALLEWCDALIAPHTGFAFLAPCLGTPWLAVSGVRWPECFFNEVPFYSVLPTCDRYPCWKDMKAECASRLQAGTTVICMDDELPSRLDDLLLGLDLVLDPQFTFAQARQLYKSRIAATGVARERFFEIS
jgi:ADP-heptose:LPS heptosyltransferase